MKNGEKILITIAGILLLLVIMKESYYYFNRNEKIEQVDPYEITNKNQEIKIYGYIYNNNNIGLANKLVSIDGVSTISSNQGYYEVSGIKLGKKTITVSDVSKENVVINNQVILYNDITTKVTKENVVSVTATRDNLGLNIKMTDNGGITTSLVDYKPGTLIGRSSDTYYKEFYILAKDIVNIHFEDEINIPNDALFVWDVSEKKNKSVMAYVLVNDNNTYELYIESEYKIMAPKNASYLFGGTDNDSAKSFSNVKKISGLNLLDTSSTTNMAYMFQNMANVKELNTSNFNTALVTDMSHMFDGCNNITDIHLENFNTSNVANMSYMFNNMNKLIGIYIDSFNTSNVTNMAYMFSNLSKISSINLNHFVTNKVTNMNSMFKNNYVAKSIRLSSFDTSNVTNMTSMFEKTISLNNLQINKFTFSKIKKSDNMFKDTNTRLDIVVQDSTAKEYIINQFKLQSPNTILTFE